MLSLMVVLGLLRAVTPPLIKTTPEIGSALASANSQLPGVAKSKSSVELLLATNRILKSSPLRLMGLMSNQPALTWSWPLKLAALIRMEDATEELIWVAPTKVRLPGL